MIIIPKYVQWTQGDDPPNATEDEVDPYQGISDSELHAALDWHLSPMNESRRDITSPSGMRVAHEFEQIQGELLRRARARHPSAH
jgi:hypothetical protein